MREGRCTWEHRRVGIGRGWGGKVGWEGKRMEGESGKGKV